MALQLLHTCDKAAMHDVYTLYFTTYYICIDQCHAKRIHDLTQLWRSVCAWQLGTFSPCWVMCFLSKIWGLPASQQNCLCVLQKIATIIPITRFSSNEITLLGANNYQCVNLGIYPSQVAILYIIYHKCI